MSKFSGPITIADQGSFFVGGRTVTAPGMFEPRKPAQTEAGQSFPVDHAFVRFQTPGKIDGLPVIMVHGQGQFSKTWETTPDGREGFASLFLRAGHPVYLVDFPRRGGAGFPSFKGEAGKLLDEVIVASRTKRFSNEEVFVYFRLGDHMGNYFNGSQFPADGLEQFFCQNIAHFEDDFDVVSDSISQLLEQTGPSILVTHSQSGTIGWKTAMKSQNITQIISFEPGPINGFLFPERLVPTPMELFDGSQVSFATPVTEEQFRALSRIPIDIIHGDYIPTGPVENWYLDIWRVRQIFARKFCEAVNETSSSAKFISLPELGIMGNSHFPMSDTNNLEIFDIMKSLIRH